MYWTKRDELLEYASAFRSVSPQDVGTRCSFVIRHGKYINHEGHEVSRRLCFPGFSSCTFAPFVDKRLETRAAGNVVIVATVNKLARISWAG